MTKTQDEAEVSRGRGRRGQVAGIVALVALAIATAAWFWTTRQGTRTDIGLPHGVIVVGAGAFVAALIAQIRTMSLTEVLEMAWDLIAGLLSIVGAILRGIWAALWGLLGWD